MSKKRLKLKEITVTSFVTEIDQLKGGAVTGAINPLDTFDVECVSFVTENINCSMRCTFQGPLTGGCKQSEQIICPTNDIPVITVIL
ncbi:MAG: pinensin family lanthipeptide [Bacteroidota bacterium]